MTKIQEIYNRIQGTRKEMREIRKDYKNALMNNQAYVDIQEELKKIKTQKKQIDEVIKEGFGKDFDRLEELKLDIDSDQQMISDIAFNQLVKGEKVLFTDVENNRYEPVFTVRFIKM